VQGEGLVPRILQVPVVVDYVISYGQSIFPAGLRCDHAPRLWLVFRISCQ
jgi:hypothetical protein